MTQNVTDLALANINQFYYIHGAKILIRFEVEERNVKTYFHFLLLENIGQPRLYFYYSRDFCFSFYLFWTDVKDAEAGKTNLAFDDKQFCK